MNKHEIQVRQKTDIVLEKSSKLMGLTNKILANRNPVAVAIKQGILECRPDLVKVVEKLWGYSASPLYVSYLSVYLLGTAGDWVNDVDWIEEEGDRFIFRNPNYIIKDDTGFETCPSFGELKLLKHEITPEQVKSYYKPVFIAYAACVGVISMPSAVGWLSTFSKEDYETKSAWEMLFSYGAIDECWIDSEDGWMYENDLEDMIYFYGLAANRNAEWSHNLIWEIMNTEQEYSGKQWAVSKMISNPSIPQELKEKWFSHMSDIPCSTTSSGTADYEYMQRIAFAEDKTKPWSPEFIREHRWELVINELCSNEAVSWTKSLIEEYIDVVNFYRLSSNKSVVWDKELLETLDDPEWEWNIPKVTSTHQLSTDAFIKKYFDCYVATGVDETFKDGIWEAACSEYSGVSLEYLEQLCSQCEFDDEARVWWVAALRSFPNTYSLKDLTFDEVNEIITHVRGYGLALKDA
ncbi:hypothetical protein ACRN96_03305 [Shewanella oncorhynchi]|uniref:hypothetical protein n=1 Tax=Shewanella TaxID=22 RepID=UPI000D39D07D|nr:hypothetical protein [Shewanella baltica]